MKIQYCHNCGERISRDDIRSNAAVKIRENWTCPGCRAEVESQHAPSDVSFGKVTMDDGDERTLAELFSGIASPRPSTAANRRRPATRNAQPKRGPRAATKPATRRRGSDRRDAEASPEPRSSSRPDAGAPASAAPSALWLGLGVLAAISVGLGAGLYVRSLPSKPAPVDASQGGTPSEAQLALLRQAWAAQQDYDRSYPERYQSRIERWQQLRSDAAGSAMEKVATREIEQLQREQARAAELHFAPLLRAVADLEGSGDVNAAARKLDSHDPELLTAAWRGKLEAARERLRKGLEARRGLLAEQQARIDAAEAYDERNPQSYLTRLKRWRTLLPLLEDASMRADVQRRIGRLETEFAEAERQAFVALSGEVDRLIAAEDWTAARRAVVTFPAELRGEGASERLNALAARITAAQSGEQPGGGQRLVLFAEGKAGRQLMANMSTQGLATLKDKVLTVRAPADRPIELFCEPKDLEEAVLTFEIRSAQGGVVVLAHRLDSAKVIAIPIGPERFGSPIDRWVKVRVELRPRQIDVKIPGNRGVVAKTDSTHGACGLRVNPGHVIQLRSIVLEIKKRRQP